MILNTGDVIRLGRQGPEILVDIEPTPIGEAVTTAGEPSQTFSDGNRITNTISGIAFYNPQQKEEKPHSYLGLALGLSGAGLLALILTIIMFSQMGFKGTMIGGIMAFFQRHFIYCCFFGSIVMILNHGGRLQVHSVGAHCLHF